MNPDQFDVVSRYRAYCAVEGVEAPEACIERYLAGEIVLSILEYSGKGITTLKKRREELMEMLHTEGSLRKDALQDAISKLDFEITRAMKTASKPIFIASDPPTKDKVSKTDHFAALGMKIG